MVGQLLTTVRKVIWLLLVKIGVLSLILEWNRVLRLVLVESGSSGWNLPRRVIVRNISIRVVEVVLAVITELLSIQPFLGVP